MPLGEGFSKTWTFFEGDWHEGNVPIMGPRTHAAWLCSVVFDGARAFEGVSPDLDLHCTRINDSARKLFLKPTVSVDTWMGLVEEGIKRFEGNTALYIRPMYWAEKEGPWVQAHDPESTRWCLSIYEAPLNKVRELTFAVPADAETIDGTREEVVGSFNPDELLGFGETGIHGFQFGARAELVVRALYEDLGNRAGFQIFITTLGRMADGHQK